MIISPTIIRGQAAGPLSDDSSCCEPANRETCNVKKPNNAYSYHFYLILHCDVLTSYRAEQANRN